MVDRFTLQPPTAPNCGLFHLNWRESPRTERWGLSEPFVSPRNERIILVPFALGLRANVVRGHLLLRSASAFPKAASMPHAKRPPAGSDVLERPVVHAQENSP